jgi:aldoxime dehydratase
MAYFGAQQLALLPPDALAPIKAMFKTQPAPPYWLEAQSHDGAGYDTRVIIAYWHNAERFAEWRRASGFERWWADPARETEPLGRFLEVVTPPMDHLEVAYSPPNLPQGAGNLQSHVSACPVVEHAYWGSARDRIPASQRDALEGDATRLTRARQGGARVRINPGRNVCMIRSGQDWSDTRDEERQIYLGQVRPKLIEGMTYLRDAGLPIGCFSCRFMQVLDDNGAATEKTFGQAYFSSLGALEQWAEHHPTHLAIFGTFMQTMAPLGDAMQLRLWHEVMVLPVEAQSFEYINCHDRTGLMSGAVT